MTFRSKDRRAAALTRLHRFAGIACMIWALVLVVNPANAWYYFLENNGERQKWVFSTSCNTGARPISFVRDTDAQVTTYLTELNNAKAAWSVPLAATLINAANSNLTMTISEVSAFMNNPRPNEIWMVWDSDGSIFQALGLDPASGVLGVGVGLSMNASRPQDLCSGILFMNGIAIGSGNGTLFNFVLKHELGHVLGFAHSIGGANGPGYVAPTVAPVSVGQRPVMFPFACSGGCPGAATLNEDDYAGARTLYGP